MIAVLTELRPGFELCPVAAQALQASIAMQWGVKEKVVSSRVYFRVNQTLPLGQTIPLNPAAAQLLQELGLSSMFTERRKVPRA